MVRIVCNDGMCVCGVCGGESCGPVGSWFGPVGSGFGPVGSDLVQWG